MNSYPEPTWANQLAAARQLPTVDLERHASVSRNNHHRCTDCFCCAAWTVLEERRAVVNLPGVRCPECGWRTGHTTTCPNGQDPRR